MNRPVEHIVVLCLLFVVQACSRGYSVNEYLTSLKAATESLERIEKHHSIEFKASLLPSDYQCLLQNRDLLSQPDSLAIICVGYQNQVFIKFDIYLNRDNKKFSIFESCKDDTEYANLNRYLFESGGQFKLIIGSDTLDPAFCQLERTYELSPYNSINLAFDAGEKLNPDQGIKLYYEDDWFDLGRLEFSWSESMLSELPKLKFN